MNKSLLAITSLLPFSSICYAQQDSAIDLAMVTKVNVDEKMVITANRFAQSTTSTLANTEIITREDIERYQAKTIPDVLRRLTGIQVNQNGGRGQLASLSVRGTNSDQVLVLVDGVRFSRAAKGSVDFNQIPLTYVDRIEYIRGSRASLYGSEAIGGVVNIITIARAKEESNKLSAGLGSLDYAEVSLASGVKTTENGQLNIAISHESDDGYNVRPLNNINDGDRHGFKSLNGLVGYTHQLNSQWSLFANIRAYENIYQYDNSYDVDWNGSIDRGYYEAKRKDKSFSLGGEYQDEQLYSQLQVNWQHQDGWDYDQAKGIGSSSTRRDKLEQTNIQWNNHYQINDIVATSAGVDWRTESYRDDYVSKTYDRDNLAAYGLISVQKEKFLAELSARVDDNQEFGREGTYNLGAGYQFVPEFGLKASYGTSFKAPNLYQQYDSWAGNKELEAETAKAVEVTFSGEIKEVYWEVTGYDYRISHLIGYDNNTWHYYNEQGESRIQGIELVSRFDTGIISHQLSADFKDPEDANGERLRRRAKTLYKWEASMGIDKFDLSLNYIYVGERPDGAEDLDAYSLFDSAISYYANDSMTISARIDNLLDEKYETAAGYASPERAYYLNVLYQF